MSILIDKNTPVIVQGITGHHGSFHAEKMIEYGTNVVAGVTPGKGGQKVTLAGREVPVFDKVNEAMSKERASFSAIFVPAAHARAAAMEAIEANLNLVIITEHIPVHDSMEIVREASKKNLAVIGPNCPGIITPGESKIGIIPNNICKKGSTGILSRSGTLTYEVVQQLSMRDMGQSTVIGIGGDMVGGLNFVEGLKMFEEDVHTEKIVVIGEIGGVAEERAAEFIKKSVSKPVVAYVAGKTAPEGKTMGHAGAIIMGSSGGYANKRAALEEAGVKVATFPHEVPELLL